MFSFRLFFFLLLLTSSVVCSAQSFDFNKQCEEAYQHIISLKLAKGKEFISQELMANPNNLIPVFLENYIDFLEVYTSGSVSDYEGKKKTFDNRINELKSGDKSSPYYLYAQAEIHTQSAVLHIKFGEYIATIFDLKKAIKKLEANQNEFPDFVPNQKSLGMLYAILGSIPQQYQGTLDFIGLGGDVTGGMKMLKIAVKDNAHPFQHEAATIYAFMLLHIQNDPDNAWQVLKANNFNAQSNLMDAYSFGHIGIYGNNCDEGISALINRPKESAYHSFPITDFLLGLGKTYRQDSDANVYFQKFLEQNKGEDYIKSTWHKMAWNELIKGNEDKYKRYLQKVANEGRAVIDTDKQAKKELDNQQLPNPILLKARMLTDGKYLDRALVILQSQTVNSFKNRYDKTEYLYRLARAYDKAKQLSKAIQYYEITIVNGRNVPYYYGANAAYLLGFLYEQQLNRLQAVKNYNLCLSLDGYEYENSIHQKAEAGLNRLKN
ncbi:MAG: tetratricopeptide (TPR) repeat protein [Chitinophagales bacterium]